MPWQSQRDPTGRGQWYQQPHPDEYSYNPGYGFFQKTPQIMEKLALKRYAVGISLAILGYLCLSLILPSFFASVFGQAFLKLPVSELTVTQSFYIIASSISFILSLGTPFVIYALAISIPRDIAVPASRRADPFFLIPAIFVGLGLSAIGRFFMLMLTSFLPLIGLEAIFVDVSLPSTPAGFVLYAIHLTLVPAVLEEFVVRGVVMQSLRRFGDGFALMASSIIFMLLHKNIVQYPYAFILGIFIGYCVLYTGSIWVGVALHFSNNLVALVQLVIDKYFGLSQTAELVMHGLFLVAALLTVTFLVKRYPSLFGIAPSGAINSPDIIFRLFYSTPAVWMAGLMMLLIALGGVRIAA